MPDLHFEVEGAEAQKYAAAPALLFKLRLAETSTPPTPIQTVVLRCQIRIEPSRRRYTDAEKARLIDLFGTPERWGQTLRPMLWTHAVAVVPPFTGTAVVDLPVPCTFDFSVAATKYFGGLEAGDIPLCFLFSGTIFYEADDGALQATQISWEKEAYYKLPAAAWQGMMDLYYPNSAWLCLRRDVFDRLKRYKSGQGLPTWEQALERLLTAGEAAQP